MRQINARHSLRPGPYWLVNLSVLLSRLIFRWLDQAMDSHFAVMPSFALLPDAIEYNLGRGLTGETLKVCLSPQELP
jgi:hypothetical protein